MNRNKDLKNYNFKFEYLIAKTALLWKENLYKPVLELRVDAGWGDPPLFKKIPMYHPTYSSETTEIHPLHLPQTFGYPPTSSTCTNNPSKLPLIKDIVKLHSSWRCIRIVQTLLYNFEIGYMNKIKVVTTKKVWCRGQPAEIKNMLCISYIITNCLHMTNLME